MTETLEDGSDWSALHRFRALASDTERFEQMFMTSLAASRSSRQNSHDIADVKATVVKQNGRIGKLESKVLPIVAVLGFLALAIPIGISAVGLFR
jgi:hypothetical protein